MATATRRPTPIDLGSLIKFEDDGPAIDISVATGATLVLDELLGITGSVQNEGGAANNDETNAAAVAGAIGFATLAVAAPCLRRWCRMPGRTARPRRSLRWW